MFVFGSKIFSPVSMRPAKLIFHWECKMIYQKRFHNFIFNDEIKQVYGNCFSDVTENLFYRRCVLDRLIFSHIIAYLFPVIPHRHL